MKQFLILNIQLGKEWSGKIRSRLGPDPEILNHDAELNIDILILYYQVYEIKLKSIAE